MAKAKGEIVGKYREYIIEANDNGTFSVYKIPKNSKGALRTIWEQSGKGEVPATWTNMNIARHILNELCDGSNVIEVNNIEYEINIDADNNINIQQTFKVAKEGLRECANDIDFQYDTAWTTRQLGAKLLEYWKENQQKFWKYLAHHNPRSEAE